MFGIVGVVLGVTSYRTLGGAFLVFDGVLLAAAVAIGVRNMKAAVIVEKHQKDVLRRMVEEGTLSQYLREIRASAHASERNVSAHAPTMESSAE